MAHYWRCGRLFGDVVHGSLEAHYIDCQDIGPGLESGISHNENLLGHAELLCTVHCTSYSISMYKVNS